MTNPIIQPTTEDDLAGLARVVDATGLFPSALLPDMVRAAQAEEGGAFWLTCHAEGAAVGLCYTVPEAMADSVWNMLALGVHPDLQGRGLGAALVAAAEDRLREMGQRLLLVETSSGDDFAGARQFYTRNGYTLEGRIRDFWADGDDKVIFRKLL